MKKMTALLLAIVLAFGCTPALAKDWKYQSENLGVSIMLPDTLQVIGDFKSRENENEIYMYFYMPENDAQINATLTYVPAFLGLQTKTLPKEEIEEWKAFFMADYPKHSKSVLIRPNYNSSQRIYRFYGMSKEGKWMLNYSGVRDGLYVSVSCEMGRFGYRRNLMQAIFEIFNDCFQMFAKSRGVDFVRYSPDDYEVEIFNLLYDDSPTSIFRNY